MKKARQNHAGHEVILTKQADNLPVPGETPGFMFGKDLLPVNADSEYAAGTRNKLNLRAEFLP